VTLLFSVERYEGVIEAYLRGLERRAILSAAADEGVGLATITGELEREGVKAFCDSYEQLLACVESKLGSLLATA
jgi:hypothetical protein